MPRLVYRLAFAALTRLPAETAHHLAFGSLRVALGAPEVRHAVRSVLGPPASLAVEALGLRFPGPLGLAAGFDKNGDAPDALAALGFGFVEVGTVTGEAQPGNDPPRLFRLLEDRALLNRMGFNNDGAERVGERLARKPRDPQTIVGINIGKTKLVENDLAHHDYEKSARLLGGHAAYCVVNVSSPNTPGLRALQSENELGRVLVAARAGLDASGSARRVPLLVKIAPDLPDERVRGIARLARDFGLDGIIATNTTISREGLRTHDVDALGAGGVSGRPLKARALEVLDILFQEVGRELVLVSAGGIETADDAWDRITHGATLLQAYTALIYEGPLFAHRVHAGLAARLAREGLADLTKAIGAVHRADRNVD